MESTHKGKFGGVSDEGRKTTEYKLHKGNFNKEFQALRDYNTKNKPHGGKYSKGK